MKRIITALIGLTLFWCGLLATQAEPVAHVILTEAEKAYLQQRGPVKLVIDPDWYPYEKMDETGQHIGISADLLALIAERTGLTFELVPTEDWDASLKAAKSGAADAVSFLNKTEARSRWLLFTEPYYTDPNVLITREGHDYISNLARLTGETIVLPEGTSMEERLRKDYPNLGVVLVKSEAEAFEYVEKKKADMTLRSLTMAAYVIKSEGYFNLKIAGEIPEYANRLRIGITREDAMLQGILNKGIASISEQEVQKAINNHVALKITKGFDYKLFAIVFGIFTLMLISSLYWLRRIQRLNQLLQETVTVDALTGLQNRYSFNNRVSEEIEIAKRYGMPLSLIVIDMDHFKRINDTYGHDAGDAVICGLSKALKAMIRKADLIARWGGEEFVVLMPGIGLEEAQQVAEKLRLGAEELVHLEREVVTISAGVSAWTDSDTIESWFRRTDKALYHAKQEGRNRVCVSEGQETSIHQVLVWDPGWDSGHGVIDHQHKALLTASNELIALTLHGNLQTAIIPKLEEVLQHIQKHFEYEEAVLEKQGYSDLEGHKALHQQLLEKAAHLLERASNGQLLPGDVVRFLVGDVVTMHLIEEDTKFFPLFSVRKSGQNEL